MQTNRTTSAEVLRSLVPGQPLAPLFVEFKRGRGRNGPVSIHASSENQEGAVQVSYDDNTGTDAVRAVIQVPETIALEGAFVLYPDYISGNVRGKKGQGPVDTGERLVLKIRSNLRAEQPNAFVSGA